MTMIVFISVLCSYSKNDQITSKYTSLEVLSRTNFGTSFLGESTTSIEKLAFREIYREVIDNEIYLYGTTPFSHTFVTEKFGRYNCQILIKENGKIRVGFPLIYTSSVIS